MLRGRSKDGTRKVTPPGPVYMSNNEFADYLKDLRTNRVTRPTGARPQPGTSRRDSDRVTKNATPVTETRTEAPVPESLRSGSAQSHRRTHSSLSTYSSVTSRTGRQLAQQPLSTPTPEATKLLKASDVVPTATYMERGQRWMEREDVSSLRDALEDMDLKSQQEEEVRIHAAAQEEASELVFRHQNPGAVPEPGAPYRYRDHMRKNSYQHARSASIGRYKGADVVRGMGSRTVSGGSIASLESASHRGRMSLDSQDFSAQYDAVTQEHELGIQANKKTYGNLASTSRSGSTRRRSSARRNVSGEIVGAFSGEQIWEEPEQEVERGRSSSIDNAPAPLRIKPKNPLNRVQFVSDAEPRSSSTPPETTKLYSWTEIHKNPPTQSRNPNYTANPLVPKELESDAKLEEKNCQVLMKDGLEIRSEEIRQATSMLLKDRSPKLPTPTVVSDRPGRPIVSFDSDWKPQEADEKPEVRRRSPFDRFHENRQKQNPSSRPIAKDITTTIPILEPADGCKSQVEHIGNPTDNPPTSQPPIPMLNLPNSSQPAIPVINLPDSSSTIPKINLPTTEPVIPSISISDSSSPIPTISFPNSTPPIPSISLPDTPDITVASATTSQRPLPNPKATGNWSNQRHNAIPRGHWSPAGKRATATCHQCQLPIEGRVVKLGGSPENFHPQCFICFCCGTSLESLEIRPEPDMNRRERLERIERREHGEQLPEVEGQTMAEDGDKRLRFYCHLDWHENFAPRCKHCTTPIMEEHMIALGHHWHYGHFFCAECGDPFQRGQSHIEKDGYAWCIGCQTKRTERRAPKCKKCRQPVIGEYVQALGGEWHDKCFRCASCQGGFSDGAFFPKVVGRETVVLCVRCIEMELKA